MRRMLLLIIVAWLFVPTASSAGAQLTPDTYGLLSRMPDLTWLDMRKTASELTSVQRTEVLVIWLIDERRHPRTRETGLGGGEITSGYIREQILKSFMGYGSIPAIRQITSDRKVGRDLQTEMRIVLGTLGDRTQIPLLTDILKRNPEPYYRCLAAESLGSMGATETIPTLKAALNDKYTAMMGNCMEPVHIGYPVRRSAQQSISILSDPKTAQAQLERMKPYTERLRGLNNDDTQRPLSPGFVRYIRACG